MSDLHAPARRAREEALARHRQELENVRKEGEQRAAILNDMLDTERTLRLQAGRSAMLWKWLFVLMAGITVMATFAYISARLHPLPWRTYEPPREVPLNVQTVGWYNKKGEWQSYDNGEVITVKHWQPR